MTGTHSGRNMVTVVYSILDRFNLTSRLFCITTNNASNNGLMRRELEEQMRTLDEESIWNSDATKIPCMAHVIQLVVKAILKAFNIELEEESLNDGGVSINDDTTVTSAIKR